jgi:hypothetical protein
VITVQLIAEGPITEMDEAQLERRDSVVDNDTEHTEVIEYFMPGEYSRAVHRSVHVHLKQGIGLEAVLGKVG